MSDPRAFITLSDIKKVAGAGEASEGFNLSSITSLIKDIADMIKSADSLVGNVTGRSSAANTPSPQSGSWAPQSAPSIQKPMMPSGEEIAQMAISALELYKLQKGDVPISQVIAELKGTENEIQKQGETMGIPGVTGDGKDGIGKILPPPTT